MSENKTPVQKTSEAPAKKEKRVRKDNFLKRIIKKFVKLCKDTVGEMRKVVWTPRAEVKKNTKLVVATVVVIGAAIAIIDTACAYIITGLAGLIG